MDAKQEPQPGDLIWVNRSIKGLSYNHCGIYEGEGYVIHFAAPEGLEINPENAIVHRTTFEKFKDGCPVRVIDIEDCFSVDETLRLARACIGKTGYNFFSFNCDHFATWCKTGKYRSIQVDDAKAILRETGIGGPISEIACTIHDIAEIIMSTCLDGGKNNNLEDFMIFGRKKDASFEEDMAKSPENIINDIISDLKPIINIVKSAFKDLKEGLSFTRKLSYEESMKYFIEHKDDSPKIAKGAILKEDVEDGFLITQVFLDSNNELLNDRLGRPLGCKIKVAQLDDELLQLFKNESLIMVE